MNKEEKRHRELKQRSMNAEVVPAPINLKDKEKLEAVVSLRFSGYELSLLRSICKKRNKKLSSLIRELVFKALDENNTITSKMRLVDQKTATITLSQFPNTISLKEITKSVEQTRTLTTI